MGGSSTAKVPAWKLRQQQRQRSAPASLDANNELGGTRPRASRPRGDDDLDKKANGTGKLPAWKLREKIKAERGDRDHNFDDDNSVVSSGSMRSTGSNYSRSSVTSHSNRTFRTVSRVPEDPSLPPAFRTMARAQRKKNPDDFFSLSSVHSRSRTDACSRTDANSLGSDSFEFLDDSDDDDSFDGEDSFASLDSDADEDDEAYRESRNQMARLKIEKQKQSQDSKRTKRFAKKTLGTPLDFIAE